MSVTDSGPLAISIGEQVRLIFHGWPEGHPKGAFPLELTWNSRTVRIPVGQSAFVPFELAKLYFGDPRSGDAVLKVKDAYGQEQYVSPRASEVKRLYDLWLPSEFGTRAVQFREIIPGDRSHFKDGIISDSIPLVTVESMDGQEIPMVVHDPYGDRRVAVQVSATEVDVMRSQVMDQAEVIDDLKRQLAETRAALGLGVDTPKRGAKTKTAPGAAEAPTDGVVSEDPKMVYNPKTNRVQAKNGGVPDSDPTSVDSLPTDED